MVVAPGAGRTTVDLIWIGALIALFLLFAAWVAACDALRGGGA